MFLMNKTSFRNTSFLILFIVGSFLVLFFSPQLKNTNLQFGNQTISLFFPPLIAVLFLTLNGIWSGYNFKLLLLTIILFAAQIFPLQNLLLNAIEPTKDDDFEKTLTFAKNIIQNKTLWGGDQLIFKEAGKSYVMQPGFRYFVAMELLVFKGLYRFVGIINVLLFVSSLFFLQKTIDHIVNNRGVKILLFLLIFLSVPYATKNILMGLSEWLAILFLIFSVYFFFYRENRFLALVFLALVPFIRQNILPAVFFILLFFYLLKPIKISYLILFLLLLLTPLYHNLYYAGEWRFLTSVFEWPFLLYEKKTVSNEIAGFSFFHVANNLLHYIGLDYKNKTPLFMIESCVFLWFFLFLYVYLKRTFKLLKSKYSFYTITGFFIILPGVFLATDYPPRFEFVNVYLIIAMFLILHQHEIKTSTTVLVSDKGYIQ